MMNSTWKIFVDAAKETPKLYFAPLRAIAKSLGQVQTEMRQGRGPVVTVAKSRATNAAKRKAMKIALKKAGFRKQK